MFFHYELPQHAASKPDPGKKPPKKPEPPKKDDKKKPVRTMMIGESPGDDLGYDPNKIPVEDI